MTNTIYGSEKGDRIALYDGPTEGNDDIFGYGGDDVIWALGGNDWIRGGAGTDIIDGGNGFDWSDYGDSGERVYVDLLTHEARYGTAQGDILIWIEGLRGSIYDDGLVGDNERNDLRGNAGDDYLIGNGGDDALWGEADDDILVGGAGGDFVFGGTGIDTASYFYSTTGVTASLLRPGSTGATPQATAICRSRTWSARISATFGR
jgi:Ca2+-binding RTX toxin-like protein